MEVTVSVIIPVYNAAEYLEACLSAVLAQDFDSYEIVCVDDGSTDETQEILTGFADREKGRVRCFRQENAGAWNARNRGLSEAAGRYIMFCDSDDRPAANWISTLYNKAESTNADIVVCGYRRVAAESRRLISEEMSISAVYDISGDKLQLAFLNSSLWNKLYKAELFKSLYKPPRPPRLAEDALLLADIYRSVSKVAFVKDILYDMTMHSSSAMSHVVQEDFEQTREAFSKLCKVYPHEYSKLCTCITFIHCAVSFPLLSQDNARGIIKETYDFLHRDFPGWKNAVTLRDVFKYKQRGKLIKIYFAFLLYRCHLFGLLIPIWRFMSNKLGIAIKW